MTRNLPRLLLPLLLAAALAVPAGAAEAPFGTWLAEDIGGAGVIDNAQTTLELQPGGLFSGSGGCNRYSGTATLDGAAITFGQVAATMMACVPALMDQEQRFFAALATVKAWRLSAEGKLELLDGQGKAAVTLSHVAPGAALTITVPTAQEVQTIKANYLCGSTTIAAEYFNAGSVSLVALTLKGEFIVAANVLSGSGARYAGGPYIWWTKGNHADLYDVTQGDNAPPTLSCEQLQP